MSSTPSVAFVTCAELVQGHPDDLLVRPPLAAAGVELDVVTWDDATVDWDSYDLVVLRSTWDYPSRLDDFMDWAASVPNLQNPLAAVRWSSDKRYLAELAAGGVPSVASRFVRPSDDAGVLSQAIDAMVHHSAGFVVKPAVGAGSIDAGRYPPGDDGGLGAAHADGLLHQGRTVLLQPYLDSVDAGGETALVYIAGQFSHAVRKEPLLCGPAEDIEGLYKEETISATAPTADQLSVGADALAGCPLGRSALLYARVDLLNGPQGEPLVLEVELIEPSLFLAEDEGAADRFARAIVDALGT